MCLIESWANQASIQLQGNTRLLIQQQFNNTSPYFEQKIHHPNSFLLRSAQTSITNTKNHTCAPGQNEQHRMRELQYSLGFKMACAKVVCQEQIENQFKI